jgi:hypothetical protein
MPAADSLAISKIFLFKLQLTIKYITYRNLAQIKNGQKKSASLKRGFDLVFGC